MSPVKRTVAPGKRAQGLILYPRWLRCLLLRMASELLGPPYFISLINVCDKVLSKALFIPRSRICDYSTLKYNTSLKQPQRISTARQRQIGEQIILQGFFELFLIRQVLCWVSEIQRKEEKKRKKWNTTPSSRRKQPSNEEPSK